MRIGIDGRLIHETGIGVYTFELLKAMLALKHSFVFVLFLKKDKISFAKKIFQNEIRCGQLELGEADFGWYGIKEQLWFPKIIKKHNIDLMHFPHFNVAIFSGVPFMVTIHDLILLGYPSIRSTRLSAWKFWLKKQGYLYVITHALKKARAVFTLTQFGKKDILEKFSHHNIDSNKIHVISEGAGHSDLEQTIKSDKNQLFKYNIKKDFLLYVGNAYPHKNLEGLILAFKMLLEKGYDYQLVIVGKDDDFRKELKQRCHGLGLWAKKDTPDQVVFTGYVNNADLTALYQNAFLYVFPSFYEGFALPPLEAMSNGLPVVSSNRTCLPEVLQDAVEYFDPEDPANIVAAVERVATSSKRRETLRKKGFQLLQKYSWENCAQKTLAQYEDFFQNVQKRVK